MKPRPIYKDFVAGIDPTGATTFGYGMDDISKTPGRRSLRKGVGMLGGAIGGALVVPSAITGLIYAGKALFGKKKGFAGGLKNIIHEFGKGVKEPYRAVADSRRIHKLFQSGGMAGRKDMPAIKRMLERQGITKEIMDKGYKSFSKKPLNAKNFMEYINKNPQVKTHMGNLIKEKRNMALATFGIGGAINSGSAMLQYNKGMDTRGELAKRRMLSASLRRR